MAKNIVLLSDGTGNRGAKNQGTNVWEVYEALERRPAGRMQLAFHEDGVGTQNFLPLRMFAAAFGYGLSRNVQNLYMTLVWNYVPPEPDAGAGTSRAGDDIYLFGFSRGAYTARALAGMIGRFGILKHDKTTQSITELRRRVSLVWDAHRKGYALRATAKWRDSNGEFDPFKHVKGFDLSREDFHHDPNPNSTSHSKDGVRVRFLGVWDTVDAVGLPFDEMADALNRVFHWRLPDQRLNPNVQTARHALSVDDERRTFWPNVWRETQADGEGEVPRIRQVWFAGVHSNVGGGYPKDQLAYVALDWMLDDAIKAGLQVRPDAVNRYRIEADPLGAKYDSRAGLGAYYRYGVRDLAKQVPSGQKVLIHESVIERVRRTPDYAPVWLPPRFDVVATRGAAPLPNPPSGLNPNHKTVSHARRLVALREVLYYSLLGATFSSIAGAFHLLASMPEILGGAAAGHRRGSNLVDGIGLWLWTGLVESWSAASAWWCLGPFVVLVMLWIVKGVLEKQSALAAREAVAPLL